MIRVVLALDDGFAIQRRQNGRWETIEYASTLEEAGTVVDRLGDELHYTSFDAFRGRRVRAGSNN